MKKSMVMIGPLFNERWLWPIIQQLAVLWTGCSPCVTRLQLCELKNDCCEIALPGKRNISAEVCLKLILTHDLTSHARSSIWDWGTFPEVCSTIKMVNGNHVQRGERRKNYRQIPRGQLVHCWGRRVSVRLSLGAFCSWDCLPWIHARNTIGKCTLPVKVLLVSYWFRLNKAPKSSSLMPSCVRVYGRTGVCALHTNQRPAIKPVKSTGAFQSSVRDGKYERATGLDIYD